MSIHFCQRPNGSTSFIWSIYSSLLSSIQGLVYLFLSPHDTLATYIHFDVSRDFWINVSHQVRITCSTWLHLSHQSLIYPESRSCLSAIETYRKRSMNWSRLKRTMASCFYSRMTSSYRIKRKQLSWGWCCFNVVFLFNFFFFPFRQTFFSCFPVFSFFSFVFWDDINYRPRFLTELTHCRGSKSDS